MIEITVNDSSTNEGNRDIDRRELLFVPALNTPLLLAAERMHTARIQNALIN